MPELPEVEVVRVGLERAVTDATIEAVAVYDERSLRRHAGPSEDFIDRLEGRGIRAAVRRGKFLWLPLAPDPQVEPAETRPTPVVEERPSAARTRLETTTPVSRRSLALAPQPPGGAEALVVHLGMSGQVLLRDRAQPDDRLTRIRLDIEHPSHGPLRLNFVDQRIFGSMSIVPLLPTPDGAPGGYGHHDPSVPAQVAHIARDPLDPAFDDRAFFTALQRRNSGIKRVLLDQGVISGIGNIYADEALWAARIHFDQPASSLSRPRAKNLLAEVRLVLTKALAEGGTSFDAQYVNVNGASGYFAHSLNAYGQHGNPCPRCGRSIRREQFMNRGSHFCAFCQRLR